MTWNCDKDTEFSSNKLGSCSKAKCLSSLPSSEKSTVKFLRLLICNEKIPNN